MKQFSFLFLKSSSPLLCRHTVFKFFLIPMSLIDEFELKEIKNNISIYKVQKKLKGLLKINMNNFFHKK